jgi:hypothetical protein
VWSSEVLDGRSELLDYVIEKTRQQDTLHTHKGKNFIVAGLVCGCMAQVLSESRRTTIGRLLDGHILGVATVIYIIIAIPAYFLLEGRVGTAGTVDSSVVIAGLALGSIMFVPAIMAILRNQRVAWGFAKETETPRR